MCLRPLLRCQEGNGKRRLLLISAIPFLYLKASFSSVSAGRDHLLAVTSAGRTFTHPTSLDANSHGQLGTRKVQVLKDSASSAANDEPTTVELSPKVQIDPYAFSSPFVRAGTQTVDSGSAKNAELVPLLYEIPSLRGIAVQKAVANERSSYILTKEGGRVLAWGANEYGSVSTDFSPCSHNQMFPTVNSALAQPLSYPLSPFLPRSRFPRTTHPDRQYAVLMSSLVRVFSYLLF